MLLKIRPFGLILAMYPAHLKRFGHTMMQQLQQLPYVNSNKILDIHQLSKLLALLMLRKHHALLIKIAFTESLFASKESNGSRPNTYQLLPLPGLQELTNWLEPLRQEPKDQPLSGQFYLAISPSTTSCSQQITSSIGQSHPRLPSLQQLLSMVN